MRYLVYGAGAVGGLLGGRLALAGFPVTFLDRPEVISSLKQTGITLHQGEATDRVFPLRGATSLAGAEEPPEIVLLTVKAYDCAEAAERLRSELPHGVPVVCVINGIGNEATLAARLGRERVIAASLTSAVQRLETGVLRIERARGIGLASGHPLSAAVAADFSRAGLAPRLYADADSLKWSKLLSNLVGNATSAILDLPVDDVFRHPGLYHLEVQALRETVHVMRGLGLRPMDLPGVPVSLLARAVFLPERLTHPILRRAAASGRGEKRPSFAYDIGRERSEVKWLNGAVVEHARQLRLPAPANSVLTETLNDLVEGRMAIEEMRGRPERLLRKAVQAGVTGLPGYNADS